MNRTLLWTALLVSALIIVFPVVDLMLDARPLSQAIQKYFHLGIDLRGGTSLLYEVDYQGSAKQMGEVMDVLKKRIDPTGTKNYIVQPRLGGQRLEIIMAGVEAEEVQRVKSLVGRSGYLTFRICADPPGVPNYEKIAQDRRKNIEPPPDYEWIPLQWNSQLHWLRVAEFLGLPHDPNWTIEQQMTARQAALAGSANQGCVYVIHEAASVGPGAAEERSKIVGQEQSQPPKPQDEQPQPKPEGQLPEKPAAEAKPESTAEARPAAGPAEVSDVEILVLKNTPLVEGADFSRTAKDQNYEDGSPIIRFGMKSVGQAQNRLGELTGKNVGKRMAIVLDGKVQGAPNIRSQIRDNGEITGYRSTEERDQVLTVLQSGSLDVELHLLSDRFIGPELGEDNIHNGLMASLIALIAVVAFIGVYYLFGGLVADIAVVLNILVTVLIMYWMQGYWTLPGIAGLVLTVGMAVDANVLVFERVREELARGSGVRLAIRNGYARAMSAIVDGNVTTLLTAIILASVGSSEVQGFAIVLIIGLTTSMFTALLVTRAIFELMLDAGLLKRFSMLQLFKSSNIPFTKIARVMIVISAVCVAGGIVASFVVGEDKFAMEFRGGTQVEFELEKDKALPIEQVRSRVARLDQGYLVGFDLPAGQAGLPESPEVEAVRAKIAALGQPYQDVIVTPAVVDKEGRLRRCNAQLFVGDEAAALQAVRQALPAAANLRSKRAADLGFGYAGATVQSQNYRGEAQSDFRYSVQVLNSKDEMVRSGDQGVETSAEMVKASIRALFAKEIKKSGELEVTVESRILTPDAVLAIQSAAGVGGRLPAPPEPQKPPAGTDQKPPAGVGQTPPEGTAPDGANPAAPQAPAAQDAPQAKAADETPAADKTADQKKSDETKAAETKADQKKAEEPKAEQPRPSRPILKDFLKYVGALEASIELRGESRLPEAVRASIDRYLREQAPDKATLAREIEPLAADSQHPGQYSKFRVFVYDPRIMSATNEAEALRTRLSWERALKEAVARPPAMNSSTIGERVSGESWHLALWAIALSLVVMILYLWFRFARFTYGLGAVVALVHDVCIALGLVIIFSWIGRNIPFIGEMKIDLPMIGAFLTLVGYSVNDTIVIFDRIRENRGKFGELSEAVVNNSINQTLSRTILTSFTVWIVCVILYFFGGVRSSIHGFSFVLAIGVVVGTYSSIVIAAPIVLWLRHKPRITSAGTMG